MRRMAIEALITVPAPPDPSPGHKVHPYLPRSMEIKRPNQVLYITYIPVASGFVYLAIVLD